MKNLFILAVIVLFSCSSEKNTTKEQGNFNSVTQKKAEKLISFTKITTIPGIQHARKTYSLQIEIEDTNIQPELGFSLFVNDKVLQEFTVLDAKENLYSIQFNVNSDFVWEEKAKYYLQNGTLEIELPNPSEQTIAMP